VRHLTEFDSQPSPGALPRRDSDVGASRASSGH